MENRLYEGVQNDIKKKIEHGIYPQGYKLASENNLCEEYNVSKVTLRKALSNLIEEHYIESKPRVGYFVKIARPGVYHFSYSLANILNIHILGEEIVKKVFTNNQGVNEFSMTKRYHNDDEEWVVLEKIRIIFKHRPPKKIKSEISDAYFTEYVASILSLAEKKKMTIEMILGSEQICEPLEIFSSDVLLNIQENYYDEYGKQFAEVLVYVPSEYANIQASNKREASDF